MDKKKFVHIINKIEMPKDMQQRIIENCYMETEKKRMNKRVKKPVAAAALAIGLCLIGVTAVAATGTLKGFFKDIKRWDGAVTGTVYEQATEEVTLHIMEVTDKLVVEITMLYSDDAPYSFFEMFGLKDYKIIDINGNVVVENENLELSEITGDKVFVHIPLDNVDDGEYTLIVNELVGSSKADQPLGLTGTWECSFIH